MQQGSVLDLIGRQESYEGKVTCSNIEAFAMSRDRVPGTTFSVVRVCVGLFAEAKVDLKLSGLP